MQWDLFGRGATGNDIPQLFFFWFFLSSRKYNKSSKWISSLGVQKRCVSWPDGYNLTSIKWYAVHLGDEDGCDGLVQSRSVHVNGGTNREHETGDPLVDGQVLFQAAEGDGKGSSTGGGGREGREGDKLGSLSVRTASTWANCWISRVVTWRPCPGRWSRPGRCRGRRWRGFSWQ